MGSSYGSDECWNSLVAPPYAKIPYSEPSQTSGVEVSTKKVDLNL